MRISDVIGPDQVVVGLRVGDKAQVLQELASRAGGALDIERRVILDALQARENLGSTGLGKGFALPHARLDAVTRPFALFARLARPIDFAAIGLDHARSGELIAVCAATGGRYTVRMLIG